MMTCKTPALPPKKQDSCNDLVGVALVSVFPGDATPLTLVLFVGIVQDSFKRAGILYSEDNFGGGLGPNSVILTIEVTDKRPALQCLSSLVRACKLQGVAEIAWFDEAEQVWRSVAGNSPYNFHELVGQLDQDAMKAAMAERARAVERCKTELHSRTEGHGNRA